MKSIVLREFEGAETKRIGERIDDEPVHFGARNHAQREHGGAPDHRIRIVQSLGDHREAGGISRITERLERHAPEAFELMDRAPGDALRRMIENSLPLVAVLAYNEVAPEVAVEAVGMVGLNG